MIRTKMRSNDDCAVILFLDGKDCIHVVTLRRQHVASPFALLSHVQLRHIHNMSSS
jgi:hypothetical protein